MEKISKMNSNVCYYIAAALFFVWFVGYMGFDRSGAYHLIFLGAVGTLIFRLIMEYTGNDDNYRN